MESNKVKRTLSETNSSSSSSDSDVEIIYSSPKRIKYDLNEISTLFSNFIETVKVGENVNVKGYVLPFTCSGLKVIHDATVRYAINLCNMAQGITFLKQRKIISYDESSRATELNDQDVINFTSSQSW